MLAAVRLLAMGLSRAKVYELLTDGRIPSIKLVRARRIPVSTPKGWVEAELALHLMSSCPSQPKTRKLKDIDTKSRGGQPPLMVLTDLETDDMVHLHLSKDAYA